MTGQTWDEPANFAETMKNLKPPPAQVIMQGDDIWKLVVFADDCEPCDCCEEPICYICDTHYADCECPGPTQDEVDYEEFDGVLYGRFTGEE